MALSNAQQYFALIQFLCERFAIEFVENRYSDLYRAFVVPFVYFSAFWCIILQSVGIRRSYTEFKMLLNIMATT